MQLMIDLNQETPAALRLASVFLSDHANLKDAIEAGVPVSINTLHPNVSVDKTFVPGNIAPIVPPPPLPVFPSADADNSSIVRNQTPPEVPPAPPVVNSAMAPAPAMVAAISGGLPEYDNAGVPWTASIHQKTKAKKKDGTWKLQKNIDVNLVTGVMQMLQGQGLIKSKEQTLPPVPTMPLAPSVSGQAQPFLPPPVFQAQDNQAPPPPPFVQTQAHPAQAPSVPLPPPLPLQLQAATPLGVPDVGQSRVVQEVTDFRSLVNKMTLLRNTGRLTSEQVNNAVTSAGAANLQMLTSMPHLIPDVNTFLDAALATA